MSLTDASIKNARPCFNSITKNATEKPYKLSDGGGLYLEVAPSGDALNTALRARKRGFPLVSILM